MEPGLVIVMEIEFPLPPQTLLVLLRPLLLTLVLLRPLFLPQMQLLLLLMMPLPLPPTQWSS
jgi:hypothetical protein